MPLNLYLNISIDGHKIGETDHTKFLGVFIDSELTWKHHISYITVKIAKGIGVITKAMVMVYGEYLCNIPRQIIYHAEKKSLNYLWCETQNSHQASIWRF